MSRTFRRNKRTNRKTERDNWYRKGAHVAGSCGNHHGCEYCRSNRLHSATLRKLAAQRQMEEWDQMRTISIHLSYSPYTKDCHGDLLVSKSNEPQRHSGFFLSQEDADGLIKAVERYIDSRKLNLYRAKLEQ